MGWGASALCCAATGFHFPDHWPRITIIGAEEAPSGRKERALAVRSTVTSQVLLRFWLAADARGPAGRDGMEKLRSPAQNRAAEPGLRHLHSVS